MEDDLDLDSSRYSIVLVVFFVSYVVFEVPSNMILSRTRPSLYLPGKTRPGAQRAGGPPS